MSRISDKCSAETIEDIFKKDKYFNVPFLRPDRKINIWNKEKHKDRNLKKEKKKKKEPNEKMGTTRVGKKGNKVLNKLILI